MNENRPLSDFVQRHPLDPQDAAVASAIRTMAAPAKGKQRGIEGRPQFDALMEGVEPRDDVGFQKDTVGGIAGLWVHPTKPRAGAAILHLHGGWFNFGTANAFRHFVGQIVARAKTSAFIPDYRLAPENPFPAATDDVWACYRGLIKQAHHQIALAGDSAGGNLALGLASRVVATSPEPTSPLVGVAVFSPVTDLALSGDTYRTRAEADPFFTRSQVAQLVHSYLGQAEPVTPWPRRFTARWLVCPPYAFRWATTRSSWTTPFFFSNGPSVPVLMLDLMCGWECLMGS